MKAAPGSDKRVAAKGKAPVFGMLKRGPIPVNDAHIEAMLDSIDARAASPAV